MEQTTKTKRSLILKAIICSVYLFLTIFYYHIDKYLSGTIYWILTALIPITFIAILIFEIQGITRIIRHKKNLTLKLRLPIIICSITILYTLFSPYRLDSEKLESEVEFRACYEGTQNQAYILFRKDKTFELHWTGSFGYNEWRTGKWQRKGNVLTLNYKGEEVEQLGREILMAEGYLKPIGKAFDRKKYPYPMFYIGYCKHEN